MMNHPPSKNLLFLNNHIDFFSTPPNIDIDHWSYKNTSSLYITLRLKMKKNNYPDARKTGELLVKLLPCICFNLLIFALSLSNIESGNLKGCNYSYWDYILQKGCFFFSFDESQ